MSTTPVGIKFTETMRGPVSFAATPDDSVELSFTLTIQVDDVDFLMIDPLTRGHAIGTVSCPGLGTDLDVTRGDFNLFVDVGGVDNVRHMQYRLFFADSGGRSLTLVGHKVVSNTGVRNVWRDTSTLFTRVLDGHVEAVDEASSTRVASGIMRIPIMSFARQMTTFRGAGGTTLGKARAFGKFGRKFMGTLKEIYLPARRFRPTDAWRPHDIPMFSVEGVDDATITTVPVTTADQLGISLQRFERAPCRDVVLLMHGLTTSTDMFIMPEHTNLVSYLLDHGYTDVWSLDWRGSNRHSYNLAHNSFSFDDVAMYDIPAAVDAIRAAAGDQVRIHVIAHCVGSITTMMSIFGGAVDGISSVVSNSVALTPRVPWWSRVKLEVTPFLLTWVVRFQYLNPRWSYLPGPGIARGKLLAKAVSLFHQECSEPACHMVSFMWGAGRPGAFRHENMHDITHERLGDLFGGVTTNYYRHIRKMVRRGLAVRMNPADPQYDALPRQYLGNVAEVDLPPVLFVTGDTNKVFADSNVVCHDVLHRLVPESKNELQVFAGYGHQDVFMGINSATDVFPRFTDFLDKHRNL